MTSTREKQKRPPGQGGRSANRERYCMNRWTTTNQRIAPKYNRKARVLDVLGVFLLLLLSGLLGICVLLLSVPR
jgi:hypothetical protein